MEKTAEEAAQCQAQLRQILLNSPYPLPEVFSTAHGDPVEHATMRH